MNKKFLNKVLHQIVSETKIRQSEINEGIDDYRIYGPFIGDKYRWLPYHYMKNPNIEDLNNFENHCREVYGLNEEESEYVWDEWEKIIEDKIKLHLLTFGDV